MKKVTFNKLTLFCILFIAASFGVKAQMIANLPTSYPFSSDSLKGFDENSAKMGSFNLGCYGDEYKVYMYNAKRNFIDAKYNLIKPEPKPFKYIIPATNNTTAKGANPTNPSILVANCQNEDFETNSFTVGSGLNVLALPSSVTGWTINGGSNSSWGSTGNCTNTASGITGNPNPSYLCSGGAGGLIDATIGSAYPIWSVFGPTTTTYPAATTANGFQCYGDWFVKLNNNTPGSSVQKMTKCIDVTSSNALLQFAFISVLQTGHCCCDNGSFRLTVLTGGSGSSCALTPTAAYTPTSCPSFTAASNSGPSSTCGSAIGGANAVCTSTGNTTIYTAAATAGVAYNKWKLVTLDLTGFIGQSIRMEVLAMDCPYSGHFGYVYFDAQCSPMDIGGNTAIYPAGTPSITLPTCGAGSTATITAPVVTGGYTWTCPGPYTVTGVGLPGQQIVTTISGNHTLTMNPPGSCSPIIRVINVIIAPAPNLSLPTNTMYSCSNTTVNGVSLQMASGTPSTSGSPNYMVTFSPTAPTGTLGCGANTCTYTGLAAGVNTITITDSVGCTATQTLNVTPLPQVPAVVITAPSGTIVGCAPPTIPLFASNSNTAVVGTVTYTWTSATQPSSVTSNYNGYGNTTYTISGSAPGTCINTVTFAVAQSTVIPTITVTPITGVLTCNGACKSFTASSAVNPNVFGTWYDPITNTALTPASGSPLILCATAPGTYVATYTNTTNGCTISQSVTVTSNTAVPTISVTSVLGGFVINCTKPCLPLNINSSGTLAPTTYTWTNLTTSVATMPFNGGYTVCTTGANTPGSYEAAFMDGNFCKVTTTINITIDTLRPSPLSMTNLPSNSYTINCFTPTLTATALTNPLYSPASYSWTQPPNLIINSNTVAISLINIPSSVTPVTYTVSAMAANGCVGKAKVFFYKDIYVPPYGVAYTPTAITCANPCVALTATTVPSTTTSVTYTFTSPPPTATATTAGALMCTPGIYTLTYQNVNNGCLGNAVTTVDLNVTPPTTLALAPIYLPCGQTTTVVFAGVTNSTSNTYSYTWDPPPAPSPSVVVGMSCPGGTACVTSSVNAAGVYEVFILNTVNGCSATNSVEVIAGNISASITPNPAFGFAPLTVNFDNTSVGGSTTAGTVTTVWNYGNGISMTYTGTAPSYSANGYPDGLSVYQAAGSYTVWLIVTQNTGTNVCVGTASTVIFVDLQSKLDIPNVFTPNGDGVNDYFTLLTTNITNITCKIFDRWGVKMYDVTSEKGNISWDGKNFSNKDVPAGTYFYILTAEGKDGKTTWMDDKGQEIKQTGTISLYR